MKSAMESHCVFQLAKSEFRDQEIEESPTVVFPVNANDGKKSIETSEHAGNLSRSSTNKLGTQIKKLPHRRSPTPVNWFPRKKATDSFLKRKIKLLQEGGGMSLPLVELLGNANPHYTRIAREKIAAQEAASKAMEARKSAMVEASWCRILQAASIQSKEAETRLEEARQSSDEAFKEAKEMGVIAFDRADCFETEFVVDREVAGAVKQALFITLSNSDKEEFRYLLRKIRQNPFCEAAFCSEVGKIEDDLVSIMAGRLKDLHEDDLSSLANIVATCGLNAALHDMQGSHGNEKKKKKRDNQICKQIVTGKFSAKKSTESDLGSILIKHVSRLEREIYEAKIAAAQKAKPSLPDDSSEITNGEFLKFQQASLDEILVKPPAHRLEREKKLAMQKENMMPPLLKKTEKIEQVESLNTILVRQPLEIERFRMEPARKSVDSITSMDSLREARERELREAWGGLSLGNSLRPHISKLEKDKAAWRRAEQEEKISQNKC